jgi:hypothetical protein
MINHSASATSYTSMGNHISQVTALNQLAELPNSPASY